MQPFLAILAQPLRFPPYACWLHAAQCDRHGPRERHVMAASPVKGWPRVPLRPQSLYEGQLVQVGVSNRGLDETTAQSVTGGGMLVASAMDLIGKTPLVALDRVYRGPGRIVAKAEFLQPGGSVKDRAAKAILLAAREDGRLKPGMPVIEKK